MRLLFDILIFGAVAAVAVSLGFGVYAMQRPGDEWRRRSNLLMRLRVGLQFFAVIVIGLAFWWKFSHS